MKVQKPRVICIVGLCGVGKSEAARIVESYAIFHTVHFGGVVIAEVQHRGLELNPKNEAMVREELREKYGMAVVAERKLSEISGALERGSNALIDGLYSYSEFLVLRRRLRHEMTVIAIHAKKPVRAERLARRAIRPLTLEQMEARDKLEVETLEKAQPIALADFHVLNESGMADLRRSLLSVLAEIFEGDFL